MRRTLHISLPQTLKNWLDLEVQRRGYASPNAFLRHLIMREQERVLQRRQNGDPPDQDDLLLPPRGLHPSRRPAP
ncbi:MAG: hypothetical protein P8K07_11650 [Candidatus Binatia bacterium]|nr:hypothetical protein [Candidatus Binatia bacterium]MDG1959169.1 hypothetical protein [Candidatus Binatia bacterium]